MCILKVASLAPLSSWSQKFSYVEGLSIATLCISQQCSGCRSDLSVCQRRVQPNFDTHRLNSHFNVRNRFRSELPLLGACHKCAFSFSVNFEFAKLFNLKKSLVYKFSDEQFFVASQRLPAYSVIEHYWGIGGLKREACSFSFVLQNKNMILVIYNNFHKFLKAFNWCTYASIFQVINVQHFSFPKIHHFNLDTWFWYLGIGCILEYFRCFSIFKN